MIGSKVPDWVDTDSEKWWVIKRLASYIMTLIAQFFLVVFTILLTCAAFGGSIIGTIVDCTMCVLQIYLLIIHYRNFRFFLYRVLK